MIPDCTRHIGILLISFHIPAAQSLKQKRMVLRRLKDRTKNKFNVSISELDGHDKWQVATLGFAMIGGDARYMESCFGHILNFVGSFKDLVVCDHDIEMV